MNIRKIIKEEIEGFDDLNWIRKVSNNPWMKYEQIIDYIVKMYKPTNIKIDTTDIFGSEETYVSLYFDEISDDYISNPQSNNIKRLKERNLSIEIRNDVYNYFGVMTSGLDLNGYSPYRYMGLTIDVHLKN